MCQNVCVYDVRHDVHIPCTRYLAINSLCYHVRETVTFLSILFASMPTLPSRMQAVCTLRK